jgi:hypothetical protein
MVGLIEEISRDAITDSVPVSTLLRKVKYAASKLDLGEVETWVDAELTGYKTQVPEYRRLRGEAWGLDPDLGWIPLGGSASIIENVRTGSTGQSAAVIEHLLSNEDPDGHLFFPHAPKIVETLNKAYRQNMTQIGARIDRSALFGVLAIVRNRILDWALALEKNGVYGSDYSFSDADREIAKAVPSPINIGHIENFSGALGQGNFVRDITTSPNA